MDATSAVPALAALAHERRLALFRALVVAGPDGLSAGAIAQALDVPPACPQIHSDKICGVVGSRGGAMFNCMRAGEGVVGGWEGGGKGDSGEGRVIARAPGAHDGRDQAAAPHVTPRFDEIEIVG